MREGLNAVLRRYGWKVTVVHEGTALERLAMIQPVSDDGGPQESGGPLGWMDERRWRYFGQGPLEAGDLVLWRRESYTVQQATELLVGQRLSHWQAVLQRTRREAV